MKLGFPLRMFSTRIMYLLRRGMNLIYYLLWLIFDLSKFKNIDNSKIKNILVIYGGAIGDIYNLLGILNQLVKKYPSLNVYYLTYEKNFKFIKNPKINPLTLEQAREMIKARKFDAALILENAEVVKSLYWDLFKIKYRAACDFLSPSLIFCQPPIFSTRRIFPHYRGGIPDWQACLKSLGFKLEDKPEFYYPAESAKEARKFVSENKLSKNKKIIFMHPGAGTISLAKRENKIPSHEWPSENWSDLADKLIEKYNARVIFTGSKEEKETISQILSKIKNKGKVIDGSGKLSIEATSLLMSKSHLLITIDTSMAHIGAQSGIPVIDLFGPYPPRLAAPWTEKKALVFHPEVCNSCRRYACPEENPVCMKAINIHEILEAAEKFLG